MQAPCFSKIVICNSDWAVFDDVTSLAVFRIAFEKTPKTLVKIRVTKLVQPRLEIEGNNIRIKFILHR